MGMREARQANIPRMWKERKVEIPGAEPEDLIMVPNNARYFAALGAIEFGKSEDGCVGCSGTANYMVDSTATCGENSGFYREPVFG